MTDTANIVLTGFMGTGKTTAGRLLAQRLGREFVDTDELIESRHGPIPEIFEREGETGFRRIEREVAAELGKRAGLVIATGGGMLVDPDTAAALGGRVFCLTAPIQEIMERVLAEQDTVIRPLLGGDDPAGRAAALLESRAEAYARFELVETGGRTPDEVVAAILERWEST